MSDRMGVNGYEREKVIEEKESQVEKNEEERQSERK
jgi:hypothetical protein